MELAGSSFDPALDDTTPLLERNTLVWAAFLVGVLLGFVAVYIVVAQPVFAQLREMQRQTLALQNDVQLLIGERHQARDAGCLLSDLKAVRVQLSDARGAVRDIRQLRQDLLDESRHTAAAGAALTDLARLQDAVLERQELTGPASRAVDQMGQVQARLVQEHAATPPAEETLRDLDRVRRDLGELVQLKQQLAGTVADLPAAKSAADGLLELKNQIVERGRDAETARTHANRLFTMQDELSAHAESSHAALGSLDRLLEINEKLAEQTPQVADAVQNLEILSDFQDELHAQIAGLSDLRRGLMEIVLLETTVGRVVKALEPLSQIVNVRRLGDHELRAAARSILDQRASRLSSRPEAPRALPRIAESDSLAPPPSAPAEPEESLDLGAEEPLAVPDPVSLPATQPAENAS